MPKVVLVARDAAPSQAGEQLVIVLEQEGVKVAPYLGMGKPLADRLADALVDVETADVVWLGMSAPEYQAEEEISVAEYASRVGVPYGFYSDTFGCYARPWFEPYRSETSFVFVLNDEDKAGALQLYPRASSLDTVVTTGNPNWEEFAFPKFTRQEVREKLRVGDDEYLILCPGTKSVPIGSYVWVGVIQALHGLLHIGKFQVILAPHPGEPTVQNGMNVYADLEKYSGNVTVRFVTKDVMATADMIPGADLVVTQTVSSTEGMRAAFLGIPTIYFLSVVDQERSFETHGTKISPPANMNIAAAVYGGNVVQLADTIYHLLFAGGGKAMQKIQRTKCVVKERGYAVREMVRVLNQVALSQKVLPESTLYELERRLREEKPEDWKI